MLLLMTRFPFFKHWELFHHTYTTFSYSFICRRTQVACIPWLLWIMLLWTWENKYLIKIMILGYIPRCGITGFYMISSVAQSCLTLCDPMDCSTPGLPVHHQLPELTQTHVHWVGGAIQPSHPLSPPSPPTFNLSQHQGLFKWVSSLHPVAKVLEFQLQHQSFQWTFRTDLL